MLKIDLHLHTIASGHAHNTILEYINQAKVLKMKMIGFSDHGSSMDGVAVNEWYFQVIKRIPAFVGGVRILKGIEANIINKKGGLDIDDKIIAEDLDFIIANLHEKTKYRDLGIKGNTESVVNAIKSGKINILSHPFSIFYKVDTDVVYEEACLHNVLLELNLFRLKKAMKTGSLLEVKKMIQVVRKYKKKIIVNSDAHNIWEMGDDSILEKAKNKIGLTKDLIINNYPKELNQLLRVE